ncbi:MAG: hypothetical protein HQ513_17970 [Rhodospirillales bacterium]|nr:hypothetical protein [Rhodospirillales bacterium]
MALKENVENKRDHDRVSDPVIRLKIGSKIYSTVNWSLGGVLIDGYEGDLSTGSLMSIKEIGLARGVMTEVNVRARVIRADEGASILAIQMLEIDQSAYTIMQKLLVKKMLVIKARPQSG